MIADQETPNIKELPIRFRNPKGSDRALILNAWLKSYRRAFCTEGITNTIFYAEHHEVAKSILDRGCVIIACDDTDPNVIIGFIAAEVVDVALVVHYVYVKNSFRGFGIGKLLYETLKAQENPEIIYASHMTDNVSRAAKRREIIYNPYLLARLAHGRNLTK